jgi:hypothetical protein
MEASEKLKETGFDMGKIQARITQDCQHCVDVLNKPENASAKKQLDGLGISFTDEKSTRLLLSEVVSMVSNQQAEIILDFLQGVNHDQG